VQHKAGETTYGNYVLGDYQEKELLLHFLQAYAETLSAVFWQAKAIQLPLLKFRLMKHHLYSEDFAQALKSNSRLLDLCDWFSQDNNGHPSLDDIAQRFSLPGMQQHTIDTVK
jgi:predicted PolB exonuclease-like 3'-5' exonuclease